MNLIVPYADPCITLNQECLSTVCQFARNYKLKMIWVMLYFYCMVSEEISVLFKVSD